MTDGANKSHVRHNPTLYLPIRAAMADWLVAYGERTVRIASMWLPKRRR